MTPLEIYNEVSAYADIPTTIICNLHSACSPQKGKTYFCSTPASKTPVIDFDEVKTHVDIAKALKSRKSVDALTINPSETYLCFVELKSWELQLTYNGSENKIRKQAAKYTSDLPVKLSDSMQLCEDISDNPNAFEGCRIIYILVTDIAVADDGIMALNSDLTALAGISSNLKELCNTLSRDIMNNIASVETRYWECRDFDKNISLL